MTTPPDLLAGLTTRIAGIIHARLPGLATCKGVTGRLDLEALKTTTFPAPAVVVSRIGMGQAEGYSGPAWSYDLQMAAFVITVEKLGLRRDEANAAICQQLLGLIPGRVWALPDYLDGARNVAETPIVTALTEKAGLALTAITWSQQIGLISAPVSEPIPVELYTRQVPETDFTPLEVQP
jgi:hypothetical protein